MLGNGQRVHISRCHTSHSVLGQRDHPYGQPKLFDAILVQLRLVHLHLVPSLGPVSHRFLLEHLVLTHRVCGLFQALSGALHGGKAQLPMASASYKLRMAFRMQIRDAVQAKGVDFTRGCERQRMVGCCRHLQIKGHIANTHAWHITTSRLLLRALDCNASSGPSKCIRIRSCFLSLLLCFVTYIYICISIDCCQQ